MVGELVLQNVTRNERLKVKGGDIAPLIGTPISQLRSVTCRMGALTYGKEHFFHLPVLITWNVSANYAEHFVMVKCCFRPMW